MPKLTVEEIGTFEVPQNKRLVNALTDEAKIDQLHACGGNARCTTCRVQFIAGEPEKMTEAEKSVLAAKGLTAHAGLRLSCQIQCDHDMTVKARARGSRCCLLGNLQRGSSLPPTGSSCAFLVEESLVARERNVQRRAILPPTRLRGGDP